MLALLGFLLALLSLPFKSKSRLEAENAVLRRQLVVLQRSFIQLYRWFPSVLKAITVIRPETLVRWHRAGFSRFWHWKSRSLGGRPQIEADLRALIWRMSIENLLWALVHGEFVITPRLASGTDRGNDTAKCSDQGRHGQAAVRQIFLPVCCH